MALLGGAMIGTGLLGPQIQWMQAQRGDPAGLACILLASLALVSIFVVIRISRKRKPFHSNLTKQLLEMPVRRFRRKHRNH
jgi:uncharacterized membrane protein (UPF0136 family)